MTLADESRRLSRVAPAQRRRLCCAMLLSDEEAEFGSDIDAEDDDARATWCGSHDNSDGRAGRSLGPWRLVKNEMPAVVADLRAGETIGQESLQTFDAEGLLVPLCYEEQEDGSVCHALKVRILRASLPFHPHAKIPADGSARASLSRSFGSISS